jgi:hypothetical protein
LKRGAEVKIQCPNCQKRYDVPENALNKKATCAKCQTTFRISARIFKGFNHNPIADINNIRNNLQDRYKNGFPILKELFQNADDATATCFDFGWHPGLPQSSHRLLKGPFLFFMNNGPFHNHEAKAIREFGISSKTAQDSTIGKFGLGLKSIFHLCEAFFYSASSITETTTSELSYNYPRTDILNPWSDIPLDDERDWDQLEDQGQFILSLDSITTKGILQIYQHGKRIPRRHWAAAYIHFLSNTTATYCRLITVTISFDISSMLDLG